MTLRSGLLALTLTLTPCAAAAAAPQTAAGTTELTVPTRAEAPASRPAVGLVDPAALTIQIRTLAQGKPHDARRFARLLMLVREPQLSLAFVSRYANLGGGAGMGLGTDVGPGVLPQRQQSRPPGMGPQPMEEPRAALTRPLMATPSVRAFSAATVIGDNPGALQAFVQTLGTNDRQVLLLQDQLSASLLLGDVLTPANVVAVDQDPATGELEIYTIP